MICVGVRCDSISMGNLYSVWSDHRGMHIYVLCEPPYVAKVMSKVTLPYCGQTGIRPSSSWWRSRHKIYVYT